MADIFLSYNEKDRDTVRRLAQTLQSVGWSVWWDRRIPAGGTWRELLESELQTMRCMVVVWSSNSVRSEWVCEEATEGRLKHCLVPVRIEDVKPPAGFREIQAADLVGWDGTTTFAGMSTLIVDIQQRIGEPKTIAMEGTRPTPHLDAMVTPTGPSTRQPSNRTIAAVLLALVVVGGAYAAFGSRQTRQPDPVADTTIRTMPATGSAMPAAAHDEGRPPQPDRLPAPKPDSTVAANAPVPVVKPGAKPATTGIHARCADLNQRFSVGDSLSAADKSFMEQRCGR